jgi:hypothetical protein
MDSRFRNSAQRGLHLAERLAAIALAVSLGACTAASASPSPSDGSAEPSLSEPAPTVSPPIDEPTPTPEVEPTATPTLVPSTGPLPSLGPVIPGRWTGLHWIAGPPSPELSEESSADPYTGVGISFRVFGWSRGYVGFRTREEYALYPDKPAGDGFAIVSETSPDGLHWTRGAALEAPDWNPRYYRQMVIKQVVEGPAGLLAMGSVNGLAGGVPFVEVLLTSTDGRSWSPVDVNKAFGGHAVMTVDAGSAGYIAVGRMSTGGPLVWTSSDGRTWHESDMPTLVFGDAIIEDVTAFAGGYVLSGGVLTDVSGVGPDTVTPSLWWSTDGKSWSRDALPGNTPGDMPSNGPFVPGGPPHMSVGRISDDALVAVQETYREQSKTWTEAVWTSTDGRTWTLRPGVDLLYAGVFSDGRRAVVVPYLPDAPSGFVVEAFEDDLTLVTLAQTGDLPTWKSVGIGYGAMGPTGLVIVANHRFLVGVPTGD